MSDYANRGFYTVRRGHAVRHGDEYFYPGMLLRADHECVAANRSKLVKAVLEGTPTATEPTGVLNAELDDEPDDEDDDE